MDETELGLGESEQAAGSVKPAAKCVPGPKSEGGQKRKGKVYGPCKVCGLVMDDMPANSKFCANHKRSVEALFSNIKADDKKNGDTDGLRRFNDIRSSAGDPPSELSQLVLDFEKACPSGGKGVKRPQCDTMQLLQRISNVTAVTKAAKMVMMHEAQWMKYAKDTLMLPHHDAAERWQFAKSNTLDSVKDNLGPDRSERLPMNTEDSIVVSNAAMFGKELVFDSKKRKVTNDQMVADAQAGLAENHLSFSDTMFQTVGGDAAQVLSRSGSAAITTHGGGAYASSSGKGGLDISIAKEPAQKPTKAWDIETQRVTLLTDLTGKYDMMAERFTTSVSACVAARKSTSSRCTGPAAVPNQKKYIDIMLNRVDILEALSVEKSEAAIEDANPEKIKQDGTTKALALAKLSGHLQKVMKATPMERTEDLPAAAKGAWDALAQEGAHQGGYGRDVFLAIGFDGDKFADEEHWTGESVPQFQLQVSYLVELYRQEAKPLDVPEYKALHSVIADLAENSGKDLKEMVVVLEKNLAQEAFKPGGCASGPHIMDIVTKSSWDGTKLTSPIDKLALAGLTAHFKDCRALRAARLRFNGVVAHKAKQGRAMPVADMETFPMLWDIHNLSSRAKVATTEDDDKAIRKAAQDIMDRMGKLNKIIVHEQNEVLNNVSTFDKKVLPDQNEHQVRKQHASKRKYPKKQKKRRYTKKNREDRRKVVAEAEKKQRQATAEEEKKRKQIEKEKGKKKKKAGEVSTQQVPLLDIEHTAVKDWQVFENEAALSEAVTNKTFAFESAAPYLLKKMPAMDSLVDDRSLKTAISCFKIQYPVSEQAKKEGRGQMPCSHERKDKIRELMLGAVPVSQVHVPSAGGENVATKTVTSVRLFGNPPANKYIGLERQSVPTIRYSMQGTRQVAVLEYKDILKYANSTKQEIQEDEQFNDYVVRLVERVGSKEALDQYSECGGAIYKATIEAGFVVVVPMCAIVVERVLGDVTVIGFRCVVLTKGKAGNDNFQLYATNYAKAHGADNPSSKFWRMLGETLGVEVPNAASSK